MDETVAQDAENNNQVNADTDDRQHALARVLGQPLTQLLDRKQVLLLEIQTVDADIYQLLVNLLQGQIGTVLEPLDMRIKRLERGR